MVNPYFLATVCNPRLVKVVLDFGNEEKLIFLTSLNSRLKFSLFTELAPWF